VDQGYILRVLQIGYDWREPAPADMAMIKQLIEIRCDIIGEVQAVKKAKV
jgi:hypothetical protein